MGWTKAMTMAACLAAGAAFAQSSTTAGPGTTPDKSTDPKSDTSKSDPGKMDTKSSAKDPKAAPKGTTADKDKDKDTSATGTGGSSTPDTTKK